MIDSGFPQWVYAPLDQLADCVCCPRNCHANRLEGKFGYCNSGSGFAIGSICAHRGEEPPIMGSHGICNIFFSRCNMGCLYCQNWQISRTRGPILEENLSLETVVNRIESILDQGCKTVGFVSPSHFIPQVQVIINALKFRNRKPVFVFNTSSYDKVQAIQSFEGHMDVYLPDLKYLDSRTARETSDTPDYPEIAKAAIREMYRQKGANVYLGDDGYIESGLIIRHLVLPGQVDNSIAVLRWIADELSPGVHVSLMSQYHPTARVANHPLLSRKVTAEEYGAVIEESERLGFYRGWTQHLSSPENYRPDFHYNHPFEFDTQLRGNNT